MTLTTYDDGPDPFADQLPFLIDEETGDRIERRVFVPELQNTLGKPCKLGQIQVIESMHEDGEPVVRWVVD